MKRQKTGVDGYWYKICSMKVKKYTKIETKTIKNVKTLTVVESASRSFPKQSARA